MAFIPVRLCITHFPIRASRLGVGLEPTLSDFHTWCVTSVRLPTVQACSTSHGMSCNSPLLYFGTATVGVEPTTFLSATLIYGCLWIGPTIRADVLPAGPRTTASFVLCCTFTGYYLDRLSVRPGYIPVNLCASPG